MGYGTIAYCDDLQQDSGLCYLSLLAFVYLPCLPLYFDAAPVAQKLSTCLHDALELPSPQTVCSNKLLYALLRGRKYSQTGLNKAMNRW